MEKEEETETVYKNTGNNQLKFSRESNADRLQNYKSDNILLLMCTLCLRSLDQVYIVSCYLNGSRLLGHKVPTITQDHICSLRGLCPKFLNDLTGKLTGNSLVISKNG